MLMMVSNIFWNISVHIGFKKSPDEDLTLDRRQQVKQLGLRCSTIHIDWCGLSHLTYLHL